MSTAGILLLREKSEAELLELLKAWVEVDESDPSAMQAVREKDEAQRERAVYISEVAQYDSDLGFPQVYRQAVLNTWTTFELGVRAFLARWLEEYLDSLKISAVTDAVQYLESPGKLAGLNKEDKSYEILDQLEYSLKLRNYHGARRFNRLFAPLGFAPQIDDSAHRILEELHHVRNVLAHGKGRATQRLIKKCPRLHLSAYGEIKLVRSDYLKYMDAIKIYTRAIVNQVGDSFAFQSHCM